MPRDIFGDVVRPSVKLGTRAWYTVPLSIAAHIAIAAVVIVVPLMATDALPAPSRVLASFVATAPPPPPPPVAPVPQQKQQTSPDSNPDAAPTSAPNRIADEVPPSPPPLGTVAEGGLPGPFGASTGTTTGLVPPPPPPTPATPKPMPVGGDIRPPAKIKDTAPVYPRIAQENRVSGIVIIEATIGADGRVTNARILKSVPLLDDAALTAVRQWQFTPTRLNGVPIPVLMTVTVAFRLD